MKIASIKIVLSTAVAIFASVAAQASKPNSCDGQFLFRPIDKVKSFPFNDQLTGILSLLQTVSETSNPDRALELVQEMRTQFKGENEQLDILSMDLRSDISFKSLDLSKVDAKNFLELENALLTHDLKMFARVIGQKNGVQLVVLPPQTSSSQQMEIQFSKIPVYFVVPVDVPGRIRGVELSHHVTSFQQELASRQLEIESRVFTALKDMRRKVLNLDTNETVQRNRPHLIFYVNGTGAFHVEKVMELNPEDIAKLPTLFDSFATLPKTPNAL